MGPAAAQVKSTTLRPSNTPLPDAARLERSASLAVADVGGAEINYPLLADPELEVAKLYGMFHPKADPKVTVRSVFVIDPQKKVRLILTYPPSAGRNVDEVLRVLDSLQLTDGRKLTTPVDWQPGDDVIIAPSVSDEDARKLYPDGWRTLKPYLRLVPAPAA